MQPPRFAYFGGRIVPYAEAKVGVLTHTLQYGTGCFGGLRAYWNPEEQELYLFRPRDHFRRFVDSARLLAMELPETEEGLLARCLELLRKEELKTDSYVRPLAYLADETVGVVRLHDMTPAISMVAFPFGKYIENDDGAHLTVSSWKRVSDDSIPARGKIAGSYVNSALAKTDAQRSGFDDAILLNARGKVAEASVSNLFMVRHGVFVTPPASDDILEGITRATLMTLVREELKLPVIERSIDRSELAIAEEVFLAGTGVQIVPVTRVDHRPVGDGRAGRVTSDVRKLYFDVVRGRVAKYRSWCVPVYAPVAAGVPGR